MILSGRCGDGDQIPSVRSFAAEVGANPLTVAKAYQAFVESGVLRMRRGVGMFVTHGGQDKLLLIERTRFLHEQWPLVRVEIRRLQLDERDLVEQVSAGGIR